jgi:hypothetical protein
MRWGFRWFHARQHTGPPCPYQITPLTVGAEEQTLPVEVPSQLLPLPPKQARACRAHAAA